MKKIILLLLFMATSAFSQDKKWTLVECVNHALDNNISIKQSEVDTELANVDKSQAIADFFPTLSGNTSYNINSGVNVNPATYQYENQTFRSLSGGLSSGVVLFSGLQNWKNLQRAKLNILANQYQLDKMKDDVSLNVANAFVQILFNKEQLKILQAQNNITKENLSRTQELVDAGILPQGDLLEIKATDATQQQQIIAAENALFFSKIGLAQLLQIEDYQKFDIVDDKSIILSESILTENVQDIILKAKETRNEIKVAEFNYKLAEKDLQLARSAYLPTLSAFASYDTRWSSTTNDPITGSRMEFVEQLYTFDGLAMGLRLSVPIFNSFRTRNNVKRSKLNVERNKYLLEQVNLDVESAVYQAYNDAQNAKKAYEASIITEEARKLAFDYAAERYAVGLSNAFDFNQSRIQYENAQSEVIRAKYDYLFKLKVLEFYFDIPITQMNMN